LDFEQAAFLRDQLRELKELPELVLVDSRKKKRDFLAIKKNSTRKRLLRQENKNRKMKKK
jgi:excinuclease UvrABC nuclease subunit